MTKDYRTRGLSTTYQVAEDDGTGSPQCNGDGTIKLAHGGLRFYKVAGNDKQDNKRLLPVDCKEFFTLKAQELKDQLVAAGVGTNDVDEKGVSILEQANAQAVILEYARVFTNPSKTFMPRNGAGRPLPDQFTLIVPKSLCVNRVGTSGGTSGGNGATRSSVPAPQNLSIFNRLRSVARPGNGVPAQPDHDEPETNGHTRAQLEENLLNVEV